MKRSNRSIYAIVILALILVGFYTIDFSSDQASVISLPSFDTQVQESQNQSIANLQDLNNSIVDIAEKTNPTVVTITTTQTVETPQNPFSRFFGPPQGQGQREVQGLGSGVIVSEDGYILTNNHVVEGADEIRVETFDGSNLQAEVVGTDPRTDIAVLQVNAENLPIIELGNSDQVRVGEFVLAIGSPFGENYAHSVSFGIVSGKGRITRMAENMGMYQNFIQTDAAINPGNSGGALINLDGELIGINTAIASQTGGNQGVGFAIPSNLAQNIMTQLIETGEVQRGYLGITGTDVNLTMAQGLGLNNDQGVIIGGVGESTPAAEAGLQDGDIIKTLNGESIQNWASFRTSIGSRQPGDEVALGILRDNEEIEVTVTLGEWPEEATASGSQQQQSPGSSNEDLQGQLGFAVQDLTPQIAQQLSLDSDQEGVVVTGVNPQSAAAQQGLEEGDVITSVARDPVQNVEEFTQAINQLAEEGNDAVVLRVIKDGNALFIAFELN